MPRGVYERKKTKKAAPKKAVRNPLLLGTPVDMREEPEVLQLTEIEVLKLEKLSAEVRAFSGDITIQRSIYEAMLQQIDPQRRLRSSLEKVQQLTSVLQAKKQEYANLQKQVGERYGIDMSKYAYDDVTGVLHDISDEAPAPAEALPTLKE